MENGNHQLEDDANNDRHIAIVELDQKFKLLGNLTMMTTKVKKWDISFAMS